MPAQCSFIDVSRYRLCGLGMKNFHVHPESIRWAPVLKRTFVKLALNLGNRPQWWGRETPFVNRKIFLVSFGKFVRELIFFCDERCSRLEVPLYIYNIYIYIYIYIKKKKSFWLQPSISPPIPHPLVLSHTLFLRVTTSKQQTADICVYM